MATLRDPNGTAIQALSPKSFFPDLRTDAKKAEDAATEAVRAGTATPEQQAAENSRQTLLNSADANNPFDIPVIPAVGLGLRAASSAVDAAPGVVKRTTQALSDAASPVFNSLRDRFAAKVPQPVGAAAAGAVPRAAAEGVDAIAPAVATSGPKLSKEASEYLASRAAPVLPVNAAAPASSNGLLGNLDTAITRPGVGAQTGLRQASAVSAGNALSGQSNDQQPISLAQQSNSNASLTTDSTSIAPPVGQPSTPILNGPIVGSKVNGGVVRSGLRYTQDDLRRDFAAAQADQPRDSSGFTSLRATQNGNFSPGEVDAVNRHIRANGSNNSFSGVGDGSVNRAYEASDQYKQGVARAQNEKAQLAAIEDQNETDRLQREAKSSSPMVRRAAREQLASKAEVQKSRADAGLRGQANLVAQQRLLLDAQDKVRQQTNTDREFNASQEKTDADQREKSLTAFNKQLETIFVGPDGKPDTVKVGLASQKITEEIGARIADLQAVPQNDPNYAQAQALASKLSRQGLNALDADDRRTLLSQLEIWNRNREAQSILPGGATFRDTRLGGYSQAGSTPNVFGSDTITLRNGNQIRANDLRYEDGPANALLPDFGKTETDRFNAGLRRGN